MNSLKSRLLKLETRSGEHVGGIAALIVLESDQSVADALFEYLDFNGLAEEPSRIIFIAGIKPK